jgi:hypothetical protein
MRDYARLCAAILFFSAAAIAQISTGTIVGVVEDSSGAVIPNAAVAIQNTGTKESRDISTNTAGEFNAPFLHVGQYVVTVTAAGFKAKTLTGITLEVDKTINLRIPLDVGAAAESVEVTAAAPLVDSATSSLGQVIENKEIVDLPLNGRNPFALGLLSGNTTPMFGMGSNLPFIAGGGRFSANEVTLDGVDNNTISNAGAIGRNGIAVVPSVDAVQEFKVKTSTFSAEFGHAAGAVVNATIKSGTNQVHGTLFEFLRNNALDANNFFQCGRPASGAISSESVRRCGGRPCGSEQDVLFCRLSGHTPKHFGRYIGYRRTAGRAAQRRLFFRTDPDLRPGDTHVQLVRRGRCRSVRGQHHPAEPAECDFSRDRRACSTSQLRLRRRAGPQLLLSARPILQHRSGRYSDRPEFLSQ